MKRLACILLVTVGCATTKPFVPFNGLPVEKVEQDPLPPDPSTYKVPVGVNPQETVTAIEAGACVDKRGNIAAEAAKPCPALSGELLSEAKALHLAQYALAYPDLRKILESDRSVWSAQRTLYENQMKQDADTIEKANPGWWDQHKFEVGMVAGFVLGTAATIGVYHLVLGH
jgi:hypothetical protein